MFKHILFRQKVIKGLNASCQQKTFRTSVGRFVDLGVLGNAIDMEMPSAKDVLV